MSRLIWSEPALVNVQRLYRFMAEKNLAAARRAVKSIRDGEQVTILAVRHQKEAGF